MICTKILSDPNKQNQPLKTVCQDSKKKPSKNKNKVGNQFQNDPT